MIALIDLGLTFLTGFLGNVQNQVPKNVVSAIQAAIDALSAHREDLITKANLESNRG